MLTESAGAPAAITVSDTVKVCEGGFAAAAVTVTVPGYVPGASDPGFTLTKIVAGAFPEAGLTESQPVPDETLVE